MVVVGSTYPLSFGRVDIQIGYRMISLTIIAYLPRVDGSRKLTSEYTIFKQLDTSLSTIFQLVVYVL